MTISWKGVEQYFTVVLFVFQFYPVCNFGLDTVRSGRVKNKIILMQELPFFRLLFSLDIK